jgi:lipopolysaccharide export system permease protein
MKILDRYVTKNFLIGYFIAFAVLIGLRIIIDLFVNIDEFAENSSLGTMTVLHNIVRYYGLNSTLYFRDFAGMITVVAAAFSLGKMTKCNELTAVLASGVSLKRVIAPILLMAVLLTGVLIIDQEIIIPSYAEELIHEKDYTPGKVQRYNLYFVADRNGSLLNSPNFDTATQVLSNPTIIIRKAVPGSLIKEVVGKISADSAKWNPQEKCWDLTNGKLIRRTDLMPDRKLSRLKREQQFETVTRYETDITPQDIPILRKEQFKTMLSSSQLSALAARSTQVKDLAQLYSQKHFRVTDPLVNLIMLMVGLPVLVCREPRAMKSAILKSFSITAACFLVTFVCKMIATESMFEKVIPEFWAWLPVIIFLPVAILELDSMQT